MDTVNYTQFFLAFILVIGMIGLMAVLLRRYGDPNKMYAVKNALSAIKVVETRFLDSKRKLMLIERGGRQHLLLLAENREMLIESFDAPAQGGDVQCND